MEEGLLRSKTGKKILMDNNLQITKIDFYFILLVWPSWRSEEEVSIFALTENKGRPLSCVFGKGNKILNKLL